MAAGAADRTPVPGSDRSVAADRQARNRWLLLVLARALPTIGAVFGLILAGRAVTTLPKVIGVALVAVSLALSVSLPRRLAARWRSR